MGEQGARFRHIFVLSRKIKEKKSKMKIRKERIYLLTLCLHVYTFTMTVHFRTPAVIFQDRSSYNSVASLREWLSHEVGRSTGCWVWALDLLLPRALPYRLVGDLHQPIDFEVCRSLVIGTSSEAFRDCPFAMNLLCTCSFITTYLLS